MSLLHKWWLTEYAEEILASLREKENHRMPFFHQSPQFKYRNSLVSWMCVIAEELSLNNTTVHLSVYILDIFMDNHRIVDARVKLVALVCLLLAAKSEEKDANVPKITELNARVQNLYPMKDFILLEFMVMNFLQWNLILPTTAHFAEYFSVFATSAVDMKTAPPQYSTFQELKTFVHQCIREVLNMSLLEPSLILVKPSLIAASSIAVARQFAQLDPKWPAQLEAVTQYEYKDLQPSVVFLINKFDLMAAHGRKRRLVESPDHGYVTEDSATNSPETNTSKRAKCLFDM